MTDGKSTYKNNLKIVTEETRRILIEKTDRKSKHLTDDDIANGKTSARKISNDTGLGYDFLRSFKLGRRGQPSADKVRKLYEYLTGKKLKDLAKKPLKL